MGVGYRIFVTSADAFNVLFLLLLSFVADLAPDLNGIARETELLGGNTDTNRGRSWNRLGDVLEHHGGRSRTNRGIGAFVRESEIAKTNKLGD